MIVNTQWLMDYLEPRPSHDEVVDALTMAGFEIEEQHRLADALDDVVIGFVREKRPLEGAEGLYVCNIEMQKNRRVDIVCASEHEVREGWGVPVAPAGVTLPTGKEIKAAKYHGVESEGMICLDGEMGLLARTTGLQVFEDESLLGKPLTEVSEVPELLVELDILPNRPDCLGLIGIAREVAAALDLKLKYPEGAALERRADGSDEVELVVESPDLCPRYMCQLIRGVKVGPSPHWLKSRLLAIGSRPINNIVDITNYVLFEWGQPLHAFDWTRIRGGRIEVRRMRPDERLELLDSRVIEGKVQPLVIADAERPVALAGIMGGEESQTDQGTQDVLLEAACFDPVSTRESARALDVRTDSSYRFERGTDPNRMLTGAMERACELILELAGGQLSGPLAESYPQPRESTVFQLSAERVSSYLGTKVTPATIRECLGKLEMGVSDQLEVRVPTWRADANDPVVLIEDVARLIGYDRIPQEPGHGAATLGRTVELDRLRQELAAHLAGLGFLECRNPPLVAPSAGETYVPQPARSIVLKNPLRSDMAILRPSLVTGLVDTAERNARRGEETFRYFEIDRVFGNGSDAPQERWMAAGIAGGDVVDADWSSTSGPYDFFHLKGAVENVLERLGVRAEYEPISRYGYLDGQTAAVMAGGTEIGVVGGIDPALLPKSKSRVPLYAFELDVEALAPAHQSERIYKHLARTPAVTRDIALVLPASVPYAEIESGIRESAGEALEKVALVDHYTGKQVPKGYRSLAIRMVFRDPERTLTTEEVNGLVEALVALLKDRHQAELRG